MQSGLFVILGKGFDDCALRGDSRVERAFKVNLRGSNVKGAAGTRVADKAIVRSPSLN